MCDKCWDAVVEIFPDKTDEEKLDILICYTSFPFGDVEQIKKQLQHLKDVGFEQVDREIDEELNSMNSSSLYYEYCPGGIV
jgi:hypothetical protein